MKFELWKSSGEWRFHLKAKNNEIVIASEGYTRKREAEQAIQLLKDNAQKAPIVVLKRQRPPSQRATRS